ncbi:pyridoxal-dependent decarboxylase [Streptomyces sp. NBC_00557]|uniref:pyridoxal-dependent decarboxylase n=1 Tax=Streptomyces sp. NBC_00557 TaxID=2975776 RepID=UPI002E81DD36|nr:pyridoxal-dependent decarboxylase [Streptomyces sp. NBC_00557]WUC39683.1 pyridoxal-dependent decarboxylase [Streptomyces sp. NBC_00557]
MCQDERRFLGFPDHLRLVTGELAPLLAAFTHHRTDPYSPTPVGVATRAYEEAVVEYFAAVAGVSAADVQGHVTSSPYEALVHGLATARRRLPAAPVYVGEQAHAGVRRACELLGLNRVSVRSRSDGTMDPGDLRLQTRLRRGVGAVVIATCGTRLHGAVDDVAELRTAAAESGRVHVHVDAAEGGLVAAHSDEVPPWSLAHGAHSITLSGHGLLGLPVPAGISLVRRAHASAAGARIAVCDPPVAGVGGGGLAALLLWTRLRSLGRAGVAAMIGRCQDLAVHAVHRLEHAGARPERVPGSLTVTFDRPPAWVVDKWQLAHAGDRARIVAMGPVTYTAVNELADDLTVAGCTNVA